MTRLIWAAVAVALVAATGWFVWPHGDEALREEHAGEAHKDEEHAEGATPGAPIRLSAEQRKAAEIAVEVVHPAPLAKVYRAPAEVRTNDYTTHNVTARCSAIVTARAVKLGDAVVKGQALATLFSSEMATAQTEYVLADEEFRRVQALNRDFVPARRYSEVDTKRRETRAKLETFGLAGAEIDALTRGPRGKQPAGQFDIVAPSAGTVIADDFRLGTVVEAGKVLFVITDVSDVWVEARVSPTIAPLIRGTNAKVFSGGLTIDARVIQVTHQIDEATRTVSVRLQAVGGALKPGLFVDAELYGEAETVMSLPTEAILRGSDGDWTIYVERADGAFEAKEVTVMHTVGGRTAIGGVAPGARIVTRGAFFLMAEAAKSGFDPHNH